MKRFSFLFAAALAVGALFASCSDCDNPNYCAECTVLGIAIPDTCGADEAGIDAYIALTSLFGSCDKTEDCP